MLIRNRIRGNYPLILKND
jgi:hypothetical protein